MANFKVPRSVEFLDELPVNATGKVVKDELRARRPRRDHGVENDGASDGPQFPWPKASSRGRADDAAADRQPVPACGIVTFPAQDSCPRCAATEMAEHLLARRGRLWAWTTQEFPPPSPPYAGPSGRDFVPFGVGYVELPAR